MKTKLLFASAILGCFIFVACTGGNQAIKKKSSSKSGKISTKDVIDDKEKSAKEKAEELALMGEQMVTPNAFFFADEIFDQALELDKENVRAIFYKAMLAPALKQKGIAKRVQPLIQKDPQANHHYRLVIDERGDKALKQWLNDGAAEDIDSEAKAIAYLDEMHAEYQKLHDYISANMDLDLTVNIPKYGFVSGNGHRQFICTYNKVNAFEYTYECEQNKTIMQRKIGRADMEVFRQIASGAQIGNILLTAYNATGLQDTFMLGRDNKLLTDRFLIEDIKKNADFGTLRQNHQIAKINAMGTDALSGARWLHSQKASICDHDGKTYGQSTDEGPITWENTYYDEDGNELVEKYVHHQSRTELVRPGYVFDNGICLDTLVSARTTADKVLAQIEASLKGDHITLEVRRDQRHAKQFGDYYSVVMTPKAFLDNPIADVKESIFSDKFNDCGQMTSVTDQSLGGVLYTKSADQFLQHLE